MSNRLFDEFLKYVAGKRVAVIGMGVSNTPLIRLLLDAGAQVTICDKKEKHLLDEQSVAEFSRCGAQFHTGEDYLAGLDQELIFKTPGMRPDMPELEAARERGSIVTSEMDVFMHLCPATVIGVTGSDGKTTTTTIIYELIKAQGKSCYVGGNIGTPLLSKAGEMTAEDYVVLELSSFQLMTMTRSPKISVITNLAPNHLDVHKDMNEYVDAKRNIYLFRPSDGRVVMNLDNDVTRALAHEVDGCIMFSRKQAAQVACFDGMIYLHGQEILRTQDIKIPGVHNVENYMAAIAATQGIVTKDTVNRVAREFGGVKHRMELVRELDGVKYYNDSIASSPSRTIAGLKALAQPVILIAGGYDKHIPFDGLGEEITQRVKRLILVGATTELIYDAVVNAPGYREGKPPINKCQSMEQAVAAAHEYAEDGDVVTLSPACASFDLYKNFAERGEHFRDLVNRL